MFVGETTKNATSYQFQLGQRGFSSVYGKFQKNFVSLCVPLLKLHWLRFLAWLCGGYVWLCGGGIGYFFQRNHWGKLIEISSQENESIRYVELEMHSSKFRVHSSMNNLHMFNNYNFQPSCTDLSGYYLWCSGPTLSAKLRQKISAKKEKRFVTGLICSFFRTTKKFNVVVRLMGLIESVVIEYS